MRLTNENPLEPCPVVLLEIQFSVSQLDLKVTWFFPVSQNAFLPFLSVKRPVKSLLLCAGALNHLYEATPHQMRSTNN